VSLAQPNQADRVGFLNASRAPIMSRGAAGNFWEALKTNGNLCDMTRHSLKMRCNSQAVGYAVRASMMLLGAAARVWRILHPCFLTVETTDLRRAKI
jgi:hypothetical protein